MGSVEEIREWTLGEVGLKKHGVPSGRKNEKESQRCSRGTFSLLSNNTKFIWHTKCNLGHFFFRAIIGLPLSSLKPGSH